MGEIKITFNVGFLTLLVAFLLLIYGKIGIDLFLFAILGIIIANLILFAAALFI